MVNNILFMGVTAFLWRLAGKGGFKNAKQVRRIAIPLLLSLISLFKGVVWYQVGAYLGAAIGLQYLSGYGIDSVIYRAIDNIVEDDVMANVITRLINGMMFTLPALFLALDAVVMYVVFGSILISLIGAFVKDDTASECLTGAVVGSLPFFI